MDFDFGNLIYILLMIAFVIFGAKGKKKKAPILGQSKGQDSSPENAGNPIVNKVSENLKKYFGDQFDTDASLDEMKDENEGDLDYNAEFDSYSDSGRSDSEAGYVHASYDRNEEEKHIPYDYEFKSEKDEIVMKNTKIKAKNTKVAFTRQLLSEFDPKKALLYSEIFGPKYF